MTEEKERTSSEQDAPPVYMIAVMARGPERRTRRWGWYRDQETAEKAILGNWTDMFEEGYYRWACVERLPEGVCQYSEPLSWFFADYNDSVRTPGHVLEPRVVRTECPPWAKQTFGWWS